MMNWDYMANGWSGWSGWSGWMGGWMGGWMWIPLALVVALLAFGVVAMLRATTTDARYRVEGPLDIAARRLAQGEITKDQYEELRATLPKVSR